MGHRLNSGHEDVGDEIEPSVTKFTMRLRPAYAEAIGRVAAGPPFAGHYKIFKIADTGQRMPVDYAVTHGRIDQDRAYRAFNRGPVRRKHYAAWFGADQRAGLDRSLRVRIPAGYAGFLVLHDNLLSEHDLRSIYVIARADLIVDRVAGGSVPSDQTQADPVLSLDGEAPARAEPTQIHDNSSTDTRHV